MHKKSIYTEECFEIVKYDCFIYTKRIKNVLALLDNYYGNKGPIKEKFGVFPTGYEKSNGIIEIVSYQKISLELGEYPVEPIMKYSYYEFEPIRLSRLVRDLINSNNNIKTTAIINRLTSFVPRDEEERKLHELLKECITFKKNEKTFDPIKTLFNHEYQNKLKAIDLFYADDSTCLGAFFPDMSTLRIIK